MLMREKRGKLIEQRLDEFKQNEVCDRISIRIETNRIY